MICVFKLHYFIPEIDLYPYKSKHLLSLSLCVNEMVDNKLVG